MTDENVQKAYEALAAHAVKGATIDPKALVSIDGKRLNSLGKDPDTAGAMALQKAFMAAGATSEGADRLMNLITLAEEAFGEGPPVIGRVKQQLQKDNEPPLSAVEGVFLQTYLGASCGIVSNPGEDPPPAQAADPSTIEGAEPAEGPMDATPGAIETVDLARGVNPALLKKLKAKQEKEPKANRDPTVETEARQTTFRDCRWLPTPEEQGDPLAFPMPALALVKAWHDMRSRIEAAVWFCQSPDPDRQAEGRRRLSILPAMLEREDVRAYYGDRVITAARAMLSHVNACLGLVPSDARRSAPVS